MASVSELLKTFEKMQKLFGGNIKVRMDVGGQKMLIPIHSCYNTETKDGETLIIITDEHDEIRRARSDVVIDMRK